MVIGSSNAGRESYLTTIGAPKVNPQSKWRVIIDNVGVANGQTRVLVIASAGLDVNFQGCRTMEEDGAGLVELWSLDLNGPTPILLDRTIRWFNGLQTHQESPITIPIIPQTGPIGMDDREAGYMGEAGTPYP